MNHLENRSIDDEDLAENAKPKTDHALQQRADTSFRGRVPLSQGSLKAMSIEAMQVIYHDLQVHQIELESQNDELRRSQLELDTSRARYFDLYDTAPVGYCTLDEEGTILEANLTAATMLGCGRNSLAGQPMTRFIHSQDQDSFFLCRKELFNSAEPQSLDVQIVKQDGTLRWVQFNASVGARYEGERQIRMVLSDVTERKIAEEALSVQKMLLELIASGASLDVSLLALARAIEKLSSDIVCSILLLDKDGIHLRVAAAPSLPEEYCRATDGLVIAEGVGSCGTAAFNRQAVIVEDINTDLLWSEFRELALAHGLRACWSTPIIDSQQRLLGTFAIYMRQPGRPSNEHLQLIELATHIAVVAINKHEAEVARDSLESQLQESQKMEAIGTLAGGIAHDFNNILAVILGNVELARIESPSPVARQRLDEIDRASMRARELVQQILSFSRRQPTQLKLTNLALIVDETVRLLRSTLPARLLIDVHCDGDSPQVMADATQIEQVLLNITTNAMQAMNGGPGRIGIRLDKVTLDSATVNSQPVLLKILAKHPGRIVRLAVTDNGPGMNATTLERIFDPFYTTKPVGEGTGLGLSVVHGIVRAHEGEIVVDSHPGKGSVFTIYLPAVEDVRRTEIEKNISTTRATPEKNSSYHILVLDDDEIVMQTVVLLLKQAGYVVSGYTHQQEAIDAIRNAPAEFDAVITDYNMPGMSGLEVAREIHGIRSDLPTAITSGFIDEVLRDGAIEAGVQRLIAKPFESQAFFEIVEKMVMRDRTKKP